MVKRKPGYGWRREITHCPYGHPYDEANTRYTKQGHRQCRMCLQRRNATHTSSDYYVPGYRDQECPICGLKWFVDASSHATIKHGVKIRGLVSESRRKNSLALLDDINHFDLDPTVMRARHRRWAAVVREEQERGGEYVARLALRWKITKSGAEGRIRRLQQIGLLGPRQGRTLRTHCRRGHAYTEDTTYITKKGTRQCNICRSVSRKLRLTGGT